MKVKIFFLIQILFFSSYYGFAQSVDNEMVYLINSNDYLQLRKRFEEDKQNIQDITIKLLAEAYINTAFNRPEEAVSNLSELITKHQEGLGINGITACMTLMSENLRYLGKYYTAADLVKSYVDQTDTFNGLDENTRSFFTGLYGLRVLGDGMKPEIQRPARDCEIQIIDNSTNSKLVKHLINVNATINGNNVIVGLDTGCDGYGANIVSEKFARDNGIRIFNDTVILYGVTTTGYAKIGKADEIKIGDIIYKNVAFVVAPGDNILPIDTLQMDAILGSVFFKAIGECRFYPKEKKIVFPIRQTVRPASGSNMFMKGGQPYIEAFTNEERLLMHLDTGGYLGLSGKYFTEHEDEVKAEGTLKSGGGIGGFGGLKYVDKYILSNFPLAIDNKNFTIPQVDVMADDDQITVFDGTIGSDILNYFDKVIFNFDQMFIIVE